MKNKYVFVTVLLAIILVVGAGLTVLYTKLQNEEPDQGQLKVVTSFYPMYIAAQNIIGDLPNVDLQNLSEPQTGCLHDYQLTSEDMKLLTTADVFIVNGGGIESFLTDIADSYPDMVIIDACENVDLEEDNAHAWMSMDLYQIQLQNICEGLAAVDPEHAEAYEEHTAAYAESVMALSEEYADVTEAMKSQPVILFHEAYEYLADQMGMNVVGVMDLDEERQVSAGEVAEILDIIQDKGVSLIFAEELYGKDMGDMIGKETDVQVIYLDTLVRGDYDKDSYLNGMSSNLELLRKVMR